MIEIVSIERGTYEELQTSFNSFVEEMKRMCSRGADKRLGEWLDRSNFVRLQGKNQDVCQILNICPRTLQTLRDSGVLGYSQFERKVYYKPEDVQAILPLVEQRKKETAMRERFKRKEVNDD